MCLAEVPKLDLETYIQNYRGKQPHLTALHSHCLLNAQLQAEPA